MPPSPIELTYEQRCASVGVLPAETLAAALNENDAALKQLRVYRAAAAASIADAPESVTAVLASVAAALSGGGAGASSHAAGEAAYEADVSTYMRASESELLLGLVFSV